MASETFSERKYAAMRQAIAGLSPSQIDDQLNLHGCPQILRDEIVDRLARLDSCIRRAKEQDLQRDYVDEAERHQADMYAGVGKD